MTIEEALTGLAKAPEQKVLEAYAAAIRGDAVFPVIFSPIQIVETPKFEAFLAYGVFCMAIQPVPVKPEDHPSKRSTSVFSVRVSMYMPHEERGENSPLYGMRLVNRLRRLTWGASYDNPDTPGLRMNFATTAFVQAPTLMPPDESTRILSCLATFKLDIDPTTGGFSS